MLNRLVFFPNINLAPAFQPTTNLVRTVKPVSLVLGFVLTFLALLTAVAIYYFIVGTRINREIGKEITTEGLSLSELVGTQVTEGQDAGITHEAFFGDSDEPAAESTNATAPDPEVKATEEDEVTSF